MMLVTALIIAVQIVGWYLSNSLSLLSDTMHVGFDGVAALISFSVARHIELRQKTIHSREEYIRRIWMRVSGALLLASLIYIAFEAYERYRDPAEVVGLGMLIAATLGLLGNIWQHRLLPHQHTSTSKMQRNHILGDLASSFAVIFAGAFIWATGWDIVDPIIAFAVVIIVGWNTIVMMIHPPKAGCH